MGHHRAQAQFDRANWRLRVLVPIWVSQALLAAGLAGLFGWRLSETLETWEDEQRVGSIPKIKLVYVFELQSLHQIEQLTATQLGMYEYRISWPCLCPYSIRNFSILSRDAHAVDVAILSHFEASMLTRRAGLGRSHIYQAAGWTLLTR
jgi:hypothetical protein